ncbi:unnamed protein product [Aphis gossypii]|uniref:Uncharacterized protein n=1 Tax=Aphis gossypii TaxID=80765 RepID=A0A9P0J2U8_APHGO|nr:unnamed protein product [Aphis gossypii]
MYMYKDKPIFIYIFICICVYARTHVGVHNGRPPFLCIVLFFSPMPSTRPTTTYCRDSRGDAKETMRNNIMCGAYMAHARANRRRTFVGRSVSVCVCVCVCRGTPRGHCSGVPVDRERERCCRESQENIRSKKNNNNKIIKKCNNNKFTYMRS